MTSLWLAAVGEVLEAQPKLGNMAIQAPPGVSGAAPARIMADLVTMRSMCCDSSSRHLPSTASLVGGARHASFFCKGVTCRTLRSDRTSARASSCAIHRRPECSARAALEMRNCSVMQAPRNALCSPVRNTELFAQRFPVGQARSGHFIRACRKKKSLRRDSRCVHQRR